MVIIHIKEVVRDRMIYFDNFIHEMKRLGIVAERRGTSSSVAVPKNGGHYGKVQF